ncbi:formate/nitrite transporter family protein [Caenispirillum salinarum]|uniref:formate/nitrite transporter family protein n=1 Tax=Caenispirillum salinarum TaxID=859058 RepID=UPI00384D9FE0
MKNGDIGDQPEETKTGEPSKAERARLTASAIYQIIRSDGESELRRPVASLWWSGVAAGIAISMSVVSEGLLYQHVPHGPWHHAISSLGYTIGFVIVVIGRLQLFTENTITAVLPVFARTTPNALRATARLWLVVFTANMVGTALAVFIAVFGGLASPEQLDAFTKVSAPILEHGWGETVRRGVTAGFIIAAVVWLLPNSRGFEIWIVVLLTYMIALGGFSHVIAGATEVFHLWAVGKADAMKVVSFISAAFIGNVIGGTGLFSLLAYGQVKKELKGEMD